MSRKNAPFIDIVKLEDKEAKLKAFIKAVVDQPAEPLDGTCGDDCVLLIARSVDSPVAKAVAQLVREGAIAQSVRTILAIMPRQDADPAAIDTFNTLAGAHCGKVLGDVRLFDAHEQFVLGPAASWIGDCMRRDPMKRDAYECYAADCTKTAGWARLSHERLWAAAADMPEVVFLAHVPQDEIDNACLVAAEGETSDTLDTRSS